MLLYKALRKLTNNIMLTYDSIKTRIVFKCNSVEYGTHLRTNGTPYIVVSLGSRGIKIGDNFSMNNGIVGNPIGQYERCTFFVSPKAAIIIGDNVGISQCALIAIDADIKLHSNVKIGGGTALYTSDFHSLDASIRRIKKDLKERKSAPITIEEDVFIGARCTILKGVTIGARSIVGAGSVVTKSIPADEIWAGSPAKFIRNV